MYFPPEISITRDALLARHPFFEEFPFLRTPFTKQLVYWSERLLMTEQNATAPVDFTLNFLDTEHKEFDQALINPEYDGHAGDEASDVAVVSFIGPGFWNPEQWKSYGDQVIAHVATVLELSKLTPEQYAANITKVIEGKNTTNYFNSVFAHAGNPSVAGAVYKYTATHLKDVRKRDFGGRLPADANIVFRHRNNGLSAKVKNDPRYSKLLCVASKIDGYRDRVGAVPIN